MQNSIPSKEILIEMLDLQPHPEGGFFKETYRSNETIHNAHLTGDYKGDRHYSTAIFFMLTSDMFSAFHRIEQDELWHFHQGSAIELHTISESGEHTKHIIGNDIANGEKPQPLPSLEGAGRWSVEETDTSEGQKWVQGRSQVQRLRE